MLSWLTARANRILNHIWPWSKMRRLQRDINLAWAIYHDYRDWSERFLALVRRILTPQQFTDLLTQYDREADAEAAAIGKIAHAHQVYIAPFPPPSPLVGDYLSIYKAAEAARAALPSQEEVQKAFDDIYKKYADVCRPSLVKDDADADDEDDVDSKEPKK